MMRAGLIGCGRIGCEFDDDAARIGIYTHAAAYRAAEGVSLHALADADPAKLAKAAERYGIPAERCYASADAMLAAGGLDLISIAAPDRFHADLALKAMATPGVRGVLLEKPLALSLDEGRAVVAAAQARGIALAVNYSRRFCPAHARVRAALDSGELGRVQTVTGFYGKGVRHNGSHWLDLLRHFFGPLASVQAWPSRAAAFEGDPSPDLRIVLASGLVAHLQASNHLDYSLFEMDIVAEHGRVQLLESGHRVIWQRVADSPYYAGYRLPQLAEVDESGMRDLLLHAVQDLRDAVLAVRVPRCSGEDGLAALQAAEAACRSLQSGQAEALP
ncbi:Gfo/Idh/MocA family protein [Chitinimonas taiwanensis]|uniref:Predicted dehydrogenase n=1 Tax=Chitinimonas taiwanensis DSM 18899 TaxID=1121279 RepID=A0A1K2HL03_9NEIS|nr:Gfo/Idh/MocA family oxidoreductase [Chitinimonas taiwanensis]SFZ77500.1 Predicted dehydrogenase [Chitinimonas taiwanensis DSM 18899]